MCKGTSFFALLNTVGWFLFGSFAMLFYIMMQYIWRETHFGHRNLYTYAL